MRRIDSGVAYENWECADLSLVPCNIRSRYAGTLWRDKNT